LKIPSGRLATNNFERSRSGPDSAEIPAKDQFDVCASVDHRCAERRRANKQALQGLAACYHVSAFSIVCVDFRVSWQKTSFVELGLDKDNARFARRAHQLG